MTERQPTLSPPTISFSDWSKAGVRLFLGATAYRVLKRAYRRLRPSDAPIAGVAAESEHDRERAGTRREAVSVEIPGRAPGLQAVLAGRALGSLLACPRCGAPDLREEDRSRSLACAGCQTRFPVKHDTPVFLEAPGDYRDRTDQTARTNPYSQAAKDLILENASGIVLDIGAGHPDDAELFGNVVRQEIIHYPSTDVVSNTLRLPFRDAVFDAVVCESVFEHVPDPVGTAGEIHRVLKPGGKIRVDSAFLQPFHGDPSHFYNMTVPGLERTFRLFRKLRSGVDAHQTASFTIRIILGQYASFVTDRDVLDAIDRLLSLPLEDLDRKITAEQHQVIGAGVYFEGIKDTPADA